VSPIKTILVVDDDAIFLDLYEDALKDSYQVIRALSGFEAFKLLRENRVDLMILDSTMPGLTGLEVLEHLRETSDLPVIMVTADKDKEVQAIETGANDFISKPWDSRVLNLRVKKELGIVDAREEMIRLIYTDNLTNTWNRGKFDLDLELDHVSHIAMFDIDHFKVFNDTYGHQGGDEALKQFVEIIQSTLNERTQTLYRYGGEEFSVLYSHHSDKEVMEHLEALLEDIRTIPIEVSEGVFTSITASIGVAHGNNYQEADKRLYIAKKSGRDQVVFQ